jgi:succinate dehydrogenase/fumarate reductase cytochrome b subunit
MKFNMTRNNFLKIVFILGVPFVVFAQGAPTTIQELLNLLFNMVRALTPIVAAAALLFFFWGLARFLWAAGSQVDKEKGRDLMIWGVIALFVMISVWGIVIMLQRTFIGTPTSAIDIDDIIIDVSGGS